jgi:single-stranded-DNA-specific exonuclease
MWSLRRADDERVAGLAAESGIALALARVLWLRGVRDAAGVRSWLAPSLADLHPAGLLPDFEPAVARIRTALARREGILVWGHDDLDGITAAAVLRRALVDLRGRTSHYIPEKGRERHGLNPDIVLEQKQRGVGLVITVDCGITNNEAIARVGRQGIDVIVTDHHEVLGGLPPAAACVAPKRSDSRYPFRGLAGVGVALKLAIGLGQEALGLAPVEFLSAQPELLALTVLGTLADRVPLIDENRTLVAAGVRSLETTPVAAVRAVREQLGAARRAGTTGFVADLLPLFASANGNEGVDRFLASTPDQARDWVAELAVRSVEWRAEAERSYAVCLSVVAVGDGVVFACGKDLNLRTLGFCAGKLKERYGLPAIVMGWRGDAWVGECRGVEGASLLDLLRAESGLLTDFGGHRKAAGFTLDEARRAEFISSAEQYCHEHFAGRVGTESRTMADAELQLSAFDTGLARLGPFGEGNPHPAFVARRERLGWNGTDWRARSRPDLGLRPARPETVVADGVDVDLLYTIDDAGQPVIVDSRPAGPD